MVAWWPLDGLNSAGEYEDLAGGDNNGTPIGKPSQVLGQYVNNSLATGVIDGVQVSPATNLNFGTGPFTIDAWVKPGPTDQAESIVSKQRGSNSGYSLFLESGRLHFQSGSLVLAGPQVSPNQWNFVAVVVEPPYVTLYVGTPFSSNLSQVSYGIPANTGLPTNSTINATNNEALIIGRSLSLNPFSNGIIIDEVEIFNRALNQRPELESIFDAGAVGKCNVLSCPAITINPITLVHPTWVANVDYPPLNLTATGVTGPYTFSVTGGTLPPGMVVDPNGTLRGRPVTPGTYDFTVKAADANGCLGMHRYQMIVAPPPCNHGNNLIENGGFETGNFDGWSLSYGNLDDGATKVDKNDWNDTLPSDHPAPSIITAASATINKQGKKIDPYCGTGMLRFNDLGGEYDATRVRRSITLTNISPCTRIQLVWGAMLEDARHAAKDSPKIEIEITRKAGKDKSTKSIYSFRADATERAAGGWEDIRQPGGENPIWYKTATVTRNVGEFENGDELDIELIVYDCNQKKHGGAAFLDCVELIDACTGNCPDPNKSPIPNPTIPNVFTPNGDGLNDLWSISNVYNACYAHVDIFNRFGNLVATNDAYELTGYTGKSIVLWDGLIDSKPSSDGTYYYLLKLKNCNESKEFTGFITVFHEAPCYTEVVSDEVEAKQHLASKNKAKRNWEDKVEVTYGKAYAKWGRAKGKDISCNKTGKKSNKKWHCVARGRPCTK
jgi:gliding motility-associated-like protein